MTTKVPKDWAERIIMLDFLRTNGWLPSKNEMMDVIHECKLMDDYKLWRKMDR